MVLVCKVYTRAPGAKELVFVAGPMSSPEGDAYMAELAKTVEPGTTITLICDVTYPEREQVEGGTDDHT